MALGWGLVFDVADILTGRMTAIDKTGKILSQVMGNYADRKETDVFTAIAKQIVRFKSDTQHLNIDGHFIFPVITDKNDESRFAFRSIRTKDDRKEKSIVFLIGEKRGRKGNGLTKSLKALIGDDLF